MAFFCPMRLPRRKREHREKDGGSLNGVGRPARRLTGSNSIESIVETVAEEAQENGEGVQEFTPTKMVAVHDFTPCVEDEVAITRGEHLDALYRETDWLYVIAGNGKEGFVPFSYCVLEEEYLRKQNEQSSVSGRKLSVQQQKSKLRNTSFQESLNNSRITSTNSFEPVQEFIKQNLGEYLVLFDFYAGDENDLEARKGDVVLLLNDDDEDWLWVGREDAEGFIPRLFVRPLEKHQNEDVAIAAANKENIVVQNSSPSVNKRQNGDLDKSVRNENHIVIPVVTLTSPEEAVGEHTASITNHSQDERSSGSYIHRKNNSRKNQPLQNNQKNAFDPGLTDKYGQEMIVTKDFTSEGPSDLTVRKGQWVYAHLQQQNVYGWLWAYDPITKTQGYVPRVSVRLPDSTPL